MDIEDDRLAVRIPSAATIGDNFVLGMHIPHIPHCSFLRHGRIQIQRASINVKCILLRLHLPLSLLCLVILVSCCR